MLNVKVKKCYRKKCKEKKRSPSATKGIKKLFSKNRGREKESNKARPAHNFMGNKLTKQSRNQCLTLTFTSVSCLNPLDEKFLNLFCLREQKAKYISKIYHPIGALKTKLCTQDLEKSKQTLVMKERLVLPGL